MIITFAMQAECQDYPVMPRAKLMIESVRRHLPDAKIIQLSNDIFPAAEGIDEVIRNPYKGDFIEWALISFIEVLKRGDDVLQIATDVLLLDNVSDVFNKDFDVAACQYPLKDRKDGAFCGDVNFVKASGLGVWEETLKIYMEKYFGEWDGAQLAFLEIFNQNRHNILPIDYQKYCYTPESLEEDISQASMVHFRGKRKEMMQQYAVNLGLAPLEMMMIGNTDSSELIENIKHAMTLPFPWLQKQEAHEGHAVIIGGGPSLKEDIEEIKERQRQGQIIFATNNTYNFLVENDIIPDCQVLLDAREDNKEFIRPISDSIHYLASQCHPAVFEKVKGKNVILWHSYADGIQEIIGDNTDDPLVGGGVTVGLKSISLAWILGYRNIHIYGFDSSYEQYHHAYAQPINDNQRVIEVVCNGKKYTTASWMASQVIEFRKFAPLLMENGVSLSVHGNGLLPDVARLMAV